MKRDKNYRHTSQTRVYPFSALVIKSLYYVNGSMRGSRRNKIHPRGNPAIVRSIPEVFPQHSYPHPRESRGFRGIPAVPISSTPVMYNDSKWPVIVTNACAFWCIISIITTYKQLLLNQLIICIFTTLYN